MASYIREAGITHVFGSPGVPNVAFTESLRRLD